MGLGEIWNVGLGTILALAVLSGLFYLKRTLRNRLFPTQEKKAPGEAMAELLLLQAKLEGKPDSSNGSGRDEDAI